VASRDNSNRLGKAGRGAVAAVMIGQDTTAKSGAERPLSNAGLQAGRRTNQRIRVGRTIRVEIRVKRSESVNSAPMLAIPR